VRLFIRRFHNGDGDSSAPFCSEAVSRAWRLAGVDLVPNLADRYTEPGDLARSAHLRLVASLPRIAK